MFKSKIVCMINRVSGLCTSNPASSQSNLCWLPERWWKKSCKKDIQFDLMGIFNAQGLLFIKELAWNICWKGGWVSVNWPTVMMLNCAFWCGMPTLQPCWLVRSLVCEWARHLAESLVDWLAVPAAAMTLYRTPNWQGCWFLARVRILVA